MILRDIYLDLDRSNYSTKVAYAFKLGSRCLCHFIGRYIWEKQVRVSGFNRVSLILAKDAVSGFYVNVCRVACISLPFDDTAYLSLEGTALQEFYIDCLLRGVRCYLSDLPDVLTAIEEGIAKFRLEGYKNEWVAKSRRFGPSQLSAKLIGCLTIERFSLRLIVHNRKKMLYDQEIFSSDPDEIAFAHRFKDIVLEEDKVAVTSRHGKPLLELVVADLFQTEDEKPTKGS
ncbi:MAG: hypothetical protein ABI273_05280 [Lacunisphaera sp.]